MSTSVFEEGSVLAQILGGGLDKEGASRKLQKTREREMQMWQDWRNSGFKDKAKLSNLLDSYRPVLKKQVGVYSGMVPIPPSAIEAEFKNHMVTAFQTYDPNRGAQLHTHVHNQLKRGKRFIVKYQNIGTIPEQRAYGAITSFNTARMELEDELGTDPSSQQLADKLGWNVREVERMEAERRQGIPTSGFKGPEGESYDPAYLLPSREMEVIRLMPYSLDPEARTVFEYTFGLGGKQQLRPGEIAKKMGVSASKVTRIRKKIEKKMGEYYGGLD